MTEVLKIAVEVRSEVSDNVDWLDECLVDVAIGLLRIKIIIKLDFIIISIDFARDKGSP